MAFRKRSRKTYRPKRSVRKVRRSRRTYRKISPIEFKTVSTSNNTDLNSTGDIVFLHPLSQGNTDVTRVGRKYQIKSINISGQVTGGSASGTARLMLVKSMNPNGVAPTLAQLLVASNPWSLRNRLMLTELKVLWDKKLPMSASTFTGQGVIRLFHCYKRLSDVVVCNDGNAGTIADVEKCAYYFIALSDKADGAGEMTLDYQSQTKYTDS